MASRADIMDLFMPTGIVEIPAGLLDPEVAHFTADDGGPVFLGPRPIGQTMIAESQLSWHPWLQLGHQLRDVEDCLGQEACVLGREC